MRNIIITAIIILTLTSCATAEQKYLDTIYEPTVVAAPPFDAFVGLSLLPNGEIRHYDHRAEADFYVSSKNNGLTWDTVKTEKGLLFADVQNPQTGEYIRLDDVEGKGFAAIIVKNHGAKDQTVETFATGFPAGKYIMVKPPVFVNDNKRIVVMTHLGDNFAKEENKGSFAFYSDDNGRTWERSHALQVPYHKAGGFHKGIRWNHAAVEPTLLELKNGKLWALMRTSHDYHYESFSDDFGQTWTKPAPSKFYATITMPTLHRLNDGRILLLWNNTTPLPEKEGVNGIWEDVFTNRNVLHAAVSADEGKSWSGFREIYLDPHRNDSDFGSKPGMDKSSHQAQVIEPEEGKLIIALGQHPLHRKIIAMDVDFITDGSREENFDDSLNNVTAFRYFAGLRGHCGYDREANGEIITDPDDEQNPVMLLTSTPDAKFENSIEGAVWNHPAAKKGTLSFRYRFNKGAKPVNVVLNDRWFNSHDTVALHENMFKFVLEPVSNDAWQTISVDWDTDKGEAVVKSKDFNQTIHINRASPHGISYLHFMLPEGTDENGVMIDDIVMKTL